MPRKRWIFLVAAVAMLAIAVPVAWATFTDVPPSNPFYADINAIQGAGMTSGCGGGNFCPLDNITRQAEAAFQHRGLPRTAQDTAIVQNSVSSSVSVPAIVGIDVPGISGGTQFLHIDATMTIDYSAGATRPFWVFYWVADGSCGGPSSPPMLITI